MVGDKILVEKKDPPVCPEFWYGQRQNSGEKERPPCMSHNFGNVGNKILVNERAPPVCSVLLVTSAEKFSRTRKNAL